MADQRAQFEDGIRTNLENRRKVLAVGAVELVLKS